MIILFLNRIRIIVLGTPDNEYVFLFFFRRAISSKKEQEADWTEKVKYENLCQYLVDEMKIN